MDTLRDLGLHEERAGHRYRIEEKRIRDNLPPYGMEVGCPSEIMVCAAEALRWANAGSVFQYLIAPTGRKLLPELSDAIEGIEVKNPSKMEEFFNSEDEMKKVFEDSRDGSYYIKTGRMVFFIE